MKKLTLILTAFMVMTLSACYPSADGSKQEVAVQGRTMGTTYSVKVIGNPDRVAAINLKKQIDELLVQINQEMSTYIPDSELSLVNKNTSTGNIEISESLAVVVREAIRIGKISDGKLDVTVGPLVNLWGFGPEYRPETVPTDEVINATRAKVGLDKLSLEGRQLTKGVPELYIDLSTIAKGYGVDKVAELVEQNGFHNYLVEIGGEMRLKGFKHTGELWHIAIEKPVSDERSVHQVVVPRDNAVATSGNYRNYFEADGVRYSHIIDPDTALPINHRLVSVTVVHPSSMTADGLSTAMMVMGEEKAMAFAKKYDLAAYIIYKTDNGFVEESTESFMQYLK